MKKSKLVIQNNMILSKSSRASKMPFLFPTSFSNIEASNCTNSLFNRSKGFPNNFGHSDAWCPSKCIWISAKWELSSNHLIKQTTNLPRILSRKVDDSWSAKNAIQNFWCLEKQITSSEITPWTTMVAVCFQTFPEIIQNQFITNESKIFSIFTSLWTTWFSNKKAKQSSNCLEYL